jgi:pyruvate dehydrogenase E2 component (dihydrolipoamide acetyltransferase)
VIEKLHAAAGDVVNVGHPLVSIRVDDGAEAAREETPSTPKPKRTAVLVGYGVDEEDEVATARRRAARRAGVEAPANGTTSATALATPPVRKLARDLGIDLAGVAGTGPNGRVTREDVERASAASSAQSLDQEPAPAQGPSDMAGDERIAVRGVRRLIAQKMARSAREIPHVTTFLTVDATWIEALRGELRPESGRSVTALPIIVRAFVEMLKEHRTLNASFDQEATEILIRGEINVGIATDTDRGLLVPVLRNADRLGIGETAGEIGRLVESARSGKATPEELTGGTVTVTNVGSFGAEYGTPIINHPESAILAVGVIEPRALVVDGHVKARPALTLSLSFDHRVLDGAEAGRAMRTLKDLLESPLRLGALPR